MTFYNQNLETEKSVAMATLVDRNCSYPCRGSECKEPATIFAGPRNRKKVLPWQHLLPGVAEKLIRYSLLHSSAKILCRGLMA